MCLNPPVFEKPLSGNLKLTMLIKDLIMDVAILSEEIINLREQKYVLCPIDQSDCRVLQVKSCASTHLVLTLALLYCHGALGC